MSSSEPINSQRHLDDTTSATLTLPDGRQLGYAEYGTPTGQPVLYLHGFPGCRIEGALFDQAASKVGARLITIDRPGFGLSSPQKNRTLLDHVQDVEMLTRHLELQRYGVLGISGGGPYALACAKALPADKLRAVSIVCGLGSPDMGYKGMEIMHWMGWTFGQRLFPGFCRWWFKRQPDARLDLSEDERAKLVRERFAKDKKKMDPKDVSVFGKIFDDPDGMRLHLRRGFEVFRQGADGLSDDFRVLNSDFGFKIEDIRKNLPVQIWHGNLDNFVPLQHAQKVAARIGGRAHLRITDDTHASISFWRQEEFIGELVRAVEGSSD